MIFINNVKYDVNYFPNGEIKFSDNIFNIDDNYQIRWVFETNEEFFILQMLVKAIRNKFFDSIIDLIVPFCPYGQQDRRINNQLFSFKYFAQLLNDCRFNSVCLYDPHSLVMDAAINNSRVLYMPNQVYNAYDLAFYPDNGASKKYSEVYPDIPYRFGNKKRNLDTGEIIRYEVIADKEDIEGKNVLIIDDLCMGGRTFKEAAKALKEMGANKIGLQITHFMRNSIDFLKEYKQYGITEIYTLANGISEIPLKYVGNDPDIHKITGFSII